MTGIDDRHRIPEPGPALESALLGDFEAHTHDSTFPERPNWRRYRIVHTPTGAVLMDQAIDRTSLAALLTALVTAVAREDPLTSDRYADPHPGVDVARQAALVYHASARRALDLA